MALVFQQILLKVANLAPSHRGNDMIFVEGAEQVVHARFCYGPMDLVALSRENVSAYVRPVGGDWQLIKTDLTDSHGKITFEVALLVPQLLPTLRLFL